jgi:hypothetical protein
MTVIDGHRDVTGSLPTHFRQQKHGLSNVQCQRSAMGGLVMAGQQEDPPASCHVLATFAPLLWLRIVYRTVCKFRTILLNTSS